MYVVLTRPLSVNGFNLSPDQAIRRVADARAVFTMLPEHNGLYTVWDGLVRKYGVIGKRGHDARLVATMILHSVPTILTFNDHDFRQFTEINVLNPFDVLNLPRS
jgi:predicted nucleic acid-binding protein